MRGVRPTEEQRNAGITCTNPDGPGELCSKYCADHPFEMPCEGCGEPVTVTYGSLEVIGAYHSGCFGYPCCACKVPHKGECDRHAEDTGRGWDREIS